ncbi:hypothetical protein Ocin01_00308 [Orchesella cincta]|uniref:Uncharacterized protein n=1 Tax=Orchesella cincta TaxID=48709 RepID=A0A1D2NM74_ORCCI|nr:hypothetical protein Ocin01_00308 [Orchesella cincta]
MSSSKLCVLILGLSIFVNGTPLKISDQLTSRSEIKPVVPDSLASATNPKGDLKASDSFGLGYYLPIVAPTFVKYHYPLLYYPTAYLHSIRHHGYGGFGFHHHGVGVIH